MIGLDQNNNTGRSCPRGTDSQTCVQTSSGCLPPALETAGQLKLDFQSSFLANRQTADPPKTNAQTPSDPQPPTQPQQAKPRTVLYGAV